MKLMFIVVKDGSPFVEPNWLTKSLALDSAAAKGVLGPAAQADALRHAEIDSLFDQPTEPLLRGSPFSNPFDPF